MTPRCVRYKTPDLSAGVCFYCAPSIPDARRVADDLEAQGYSVTLGVCPECRKRLAMDSAKGTVWGLAI